MRSKPTLRWMAVSAAAMSVIAAGSSSATVSAAPTRPSPATAECETAPDLARVRSGSTAKEPEL